MKTDYFTFFDILPAVLWLVIILVAGIAIRNANLDKPHYKYYLPNLYAKLIFSLGFALVYIFYYGGGDTTAFFESSVSMNNLFMKSPSMFFEKLITEPTRDNWTVYFDARTGYPPHWIYKEPEAFFVSKIMSFFTFFTLKSYIASTFLIAYITSIASWRLFELTRSYNFCNEKFPAIGILFLPSVNFWCSGISKDSVVFISAAFAVYHGFKIVSLTHKSGLKNWIFFILNMFIIYHIRDFIFIAILVPLTLSISARIVKTYGGGDYVVILVRTMIFAGGMVAIGGSLISQTEEDFLETNTFLKQAAVIQDDFANNDTYGDKRYSLGEIEFTPLGLIKVMPIAILTGIYRPYIWESLSPTLILNGLESIVFLYFTFLFFRRKPLEKFKKIRSHEFLIFALFFVLIIAFMTGLTSGLYGVLVRLRAILLPFLFVLLTFEVDRKELEETNE